MTEIRCAVECRSDESRRGPGRLVGTLLTYGERAGDRPERFAAGALRWPDDGISLTEEHGGGTITRVLPEVRGRDVLIETLLPDTPARPGRGDADPQRHLSRAVGRVPGAG